MFTIYSDKDIFENIISSPSDYPNWNKIINNHSAVCLDINEVDLDTELDNPDSILFLFIQSNAREINLVSSDNYINSIYENPEKLIENPRSIFFLNIDSDKAFKLQEDNGIIVQSGDEIDDNILLGSYFKLLNKNSVCESGKDLGWKSILNFNLPPSNSLIISDNYLFKNEEHRIVVGEPNIVYLLDALLQKKLNIRYHILIIAEDNRKSNAWCEDLKDKISKQIKALRPYEIIIEFVFSVTIHKRSILSNYYFGFADKGFSVFSTRDNKTIREDNDFTLDRIFNNVNSFGGDVVYTQKEDALRRIYKKFIEVFQWLQKNDPIENRRIIGDCNSDYSIKNRLLNDI
jgi:hypothetical protein